MTTTFSQKQKNAIEEYLRKNLSEPNNDPVFFTNLLLTAAKYDHRFRTALFEWVNHKTTITDFCINGYYLSELASFYIDTRLGVLVAMRLLWDEMIGFKNICLTIGQSCIADNWILKGKLTELAILEEDGWYFYGSPDKEDTLQEPGAFSLYQLCEADSSLLSLVTSDDIPPGKSYVLRRDNNFELFIEDNSPSI